MKKLIICCFAIALSLFSDYAQLVDAALKAQERAYAPYSHYFVGAAILTKSGKIFSGCNVENASYGLTVCAERTAAFKAVSEGETEFEAIAIATKDGGLSCGACRQVLNEFGPNCTIIAVNEKGNICYEEPLSELLPLSFGPKNLEQ